MGLSKARPSLARTWRGSEEFAVEPPAPQCWGARPHAVLSRAVRSTSQAFAADMARRGLRWRREAPPRPCPSFLPCVWGKEEAWKTLPGGGGSSLSPPLSF